MAEETAGFLDCLFAPYGGAGQVEIRCLKRAETGNGFAPRQWFPLTPGGLAAAEKAAVVWGERWNVYFGVLPRSKKGEGGADAVTGAAWLWCDIDRARQWEMAAELLRTAELPLPHLAVSSGNGIHAYWRLAEVECLPDGESKARFRSLLRRLCAAVGGEPNGPHADMASTDAARILRLPGTWNWKNLAEPKPVCAAFSRPDAPAFTAAQWSGILAAEEKRETRPNRPESRHSRYVTHHRLLLEVSPEGSRHRNCVRLLMAMRGRDAGAAEIERAGRDFCALNHFPAEEMEAILVWAVRR